MNPVVRLLRDLIALPSVNPAFAAGAGSLSGEHRVGDYLLAVGARAGLSVERWPVTEGRSNVLIRLSPAGRVRHRVVMAPHMDTVTVEEPGQLEPRVKGGRVHGRGACDTKGSVATMFQALVTVARGGGRRPGSTEIVLAALVDEESGQAGSRSLVAGGFKADLAIVGEPTLLTVVTAHKGDLWLSAETRGRAAHSSCPERGRNAIAEMARVVSILEGEYAAGLRRRRHPLLGAATVNVGMIAGGRQPNIVPDRCEIRIDRRTLPGETDAGVTRGIRALLRSKGVSVRVADWKGLPAVPLETDPRLPLVRGLMTAAGQRRPAGVHYFSDAGVLSGGGIPSVVFGPGDIAQAHTRDEWVGVRQLERGVAVLTRFLEALP